MPIFLQGVCGSTAPASPALGLTQRSSYLGARLPMQPRSGAVFPGEPTCSWAGRLAIGPYQPHPKTHSSLGLGKLSPRASGTVCHSLEKEALESSLFDMQRQLAQLEARRELLEAESQALLLAKETLTGTSVWVLGFVLDFGCGYCSLAEVRNPR